MTWDSLCDEMLHRMMCYVESTLYLREVAWVRDAKDAIGCHLYADADFAGCKRSGRSTSGAFFCLAGPDTFFRIQAHSKKQTAVSHSTPEAGIVSADSAARTIGTPVLSLWGTLLGQDNVLIFHDDNTAMIRV